MQNSNTNQPNLVELLRPIRRGGWVILLIVVVAVGAALALSLSQRKQYTAVASYQFRDQSQQLGLVAVPVAPTLTPAQLASQAVQTILEPEVLSRVRRSLPASLRNLRLASSVSASVDPNSSYVQVNATATTASGAARVANAFAASAVYVANHTQRAQYAADAARLAKQHPRRSNFNATSLLQQEVARLQQLASIAAPAQLVAAATPPSSPSSPKPIRNAGIAGALGLMVGLLIVYVWDALDRRLRSADDIERQFGYPLVGRVRDGALGNSPNAVERDRVVEPVDWEQFRILHRNVEFLGTNGRPRMIAVTSAMPQEGKTTVASFMAFAAAAAGQRTLLIECDLRRPVLAKRLGINHAPGVTDYVLGAASPSDVVQLVTFNDVMATNGAAPPVATESEFPDPKALFRREFVCLTAGSPTDHPVEVLASGAFRTMLSQVRTAYDVVILDTAPILPVVDTLEVVENTEAIVICAREAQLTRDQARAGKRALDRAAGQVVCLVVTGIKPGSPDYDYYTSYASYAT